MSSTRAFLRQSKLFVENNMIPIFLVFCVLTSVLGGTIDRKIVGGIDSNIQNFPYVVQIERNGEFYCGGTIISDHWVVTAAYCVSQIAVGELSVLAGSNRLGQGTQYTVTRMIIHPDWDIATEHSDIALIRVAPTIQFNDYVQPAELFPEEPEAGADALISGWGHITEQNSTMQDILKTAIVPIVERATCDDIFGFIDNSQICAGYVNGGADPCLGDGGGPLTIHRQLAGIIATGIGCARPEIPSIYTNVHYFHGWIIDNINP